MQTLFTESLIGHYRLFFLVASAVYICLAVVLRHRVLPLWSVLLLVGAGIAVRAAFIGTQPLGSDDLYRYLWDGRVQSAGIDPYAHAPGDSALVSLHTADLPARVNHPSLRSPYPPLSEWLFWLSWQIAGEDVRGFKILLLIAECLTLWGIDRALRLLHLPRQNILLYALCPLPVVQFALDGHVDAFGIALLILAMVLWLRERKLWSLITLGLSLAIKPVGIVLLPGLVLSARGWRERVTCVLVPLATLGLLYVPYLWTSDPFAGILAFGKDWSYNGPLFDLLMTVLRDNMPARRICSVLLAAALLGLAWRKAPYSITAYRSILLLLIFSPVVHPWYIAWLAALVPLVYAWSGVVFLATASLTSFTVFSYVTNGAWGLSPWLMALEYIPVVMLFLSELGLFSRWKTQQN